MQKNIYIYLDDERTFKPNVYSKEADVHICRSYEDAIAIIENFRRTGWTNLMIDLDHDLGSQKTGYDFCKYLVEKNIVGNFHCHTANPVGRFNMTQLLNHYGWKEF